VWAPQSATVMPSGLSEVECYDYSTAQGRLELDDIGGTSNAVRGSLETMFNDQGVKELDETLHDPAMRAAQQGALAAPWASGFSQ